jgi:hypothetical protein
LFPPSVQRFGYKLLCFVSHTHHFLLISQVADVSKKGWTDLSGIFGKSVSLYEDPNESILHNGLSNSNSYTDYSSGSSSGNSGSSSGGGGYQQQDHYQSRDEEHAFSSRQKSQSQTSRMNQRQDQGYQSGGASSETNSLLSTSSYSSHSSPHASPSSSSSSTKTKVKSSSSSANSSNKSRSENVSVPKSGIQVSREEKTLLDLESEFNPSKSKNKPKTIEDEFWADLEK